jgi:hypothetical protein
MTREYGRENRHKEGKTRKKTTIMTSKRFLLPDGLDLIHILAFVREYLTKDITL